MIDKIHPKRMRLILIMGASALFLIGLTTGLLLGSYMSSGKEEGSTPPPGMETPAPTGVMGVDKVGVVSLLPDADVQWFVRFSHCDHRYAEDRQDDLTGMTLEEVQHAYPDYVIEDFTSSAATLVREVGGYCPDHYIVRLADNVIAVYKTSDETFKELRVMVLSVEAAELNDEVRQELTEGVAFSNFAEIDEFFENAES